MCAYFQSAVKCVIPPLILRTEINDVEWKKFIEALSPPFTPSLSLSLFLHLSPPLPHCAPLSVFMVALLSCSPTHHCSGWSRIINFRIMPMQRFSTAGHSVDSTENCKETQHTQGNRSKRILIFLTF